MGRALATPGSDVVFARLLEKAREAGMAGDALRQIHGREAWSERTWIWERIMRALRDDGFPIRVARCYSVDEIGALGMVAKVAPDLRSALERMVHFQHVLTGTPLSRIRDVASRRVTRFEVLPVEGHGLGARCRREEMVASGLELARGITGVKLRPSRACFAHAAPSDTSEHERFFECPVEFDAEFDGFELDARTLALPLPHADSELSEFWVQHLRAVGGEPPAPESALESRLRQLLRDRVGTAVPSMGEVARELGMSPRTLRRRLLQCGTGYHEILEEVRYERADELLATPGRKVAEVAELLGFSDASAFHRAYVRWTGRTPAGRHVARG